MRFITVIDERGHLVCEWCEVADTALSRLRTLVVRHSLAEGEGLLIRPSWSVHTWFMHDSIDVVFLDRDCRVLATVESVAPWHAVAHRGAYAALELPAGTLARTELEAGSPLGWGTPAGAAAA